MKHEWYVPCDARDCSLWIDQRVLGMARFKQCHVMNLSSLLREIINYLASQNCDYEDDPGRRLIDVLLDQLRAQKEIKNTLAMPKDRRLVELCTALIASPGEDFHVSQWARKLGMSERNLGRLFRRETGTSFSQWRKIQRMEAAHSRLSQGENVTTVAMDCGYSSVSAFTAVFREIFGITPGKARFKK